jgi:sulfite exporter TauE/SafE
MMAFALGVSAMMLALAFGTREVVAKRQQALRLLAGKAKLILGITFLLVGAGILFGVDHWLESQVLDILPEWLQDLSVSV